MFDSGANWTVYLAVNLLGLQEFEQRRVENVRRFEVRNVSRVRDDHQFGARYGVGDVFGQFGKIRAILLAADHQRLRL